MKNKNLLFSIITAIILMLIIILYEGHFLFRNTPPAAEKEETGQGEPSAGPFPQGPFPVEYRHERRNIGGNPQEIHILELDVSDPGVEVLPVLSHDSVFGYEVLSSIARRSGAYAAVNAGFFHEYGLPGGLVMAGGRLLTSTEADYPVFSVSGGKASLQEFSIKHWVEINGDRIGVDKVNAAWNAGKVIVYTPAYGSTNRAKVLNTTLTIEDDKIVKSGTSAGETDIPENGMLLTFYHPYGDAPQLQVKKGDRAVFGYVPYLGEDANAYQCGCWIVKDGRAVIGDFDRWIGTLSNQDPRTVLGLKDSTTVVLITVDGRQPGYSAGLTGKELAGLLLEMGVNNAAMLDGGASTEMVVREKIVNKPSFRGSERPLGGAIVVRVRN